MVLRLFNLQLNFKPTPLFSKISKSNLTACEPNLHTDRKNEIFQKSKMKSIEIGASVQKFRYLWRKEK